MLATSASGSLVLASMTLASLAVCFKDSWSVLISTPMKMLVVDHLFPDPFYILSPFANFPHILSFVQYKYSPVRVIRK
jgi:hypothetical protein